MPELESEILELDVRWSARYDLGRQDYWARDFDHFYMPSSMVQRALDKSPELRLGYYETMFSYGTGDC